MLNKEQVQELHEMMMRREGIFEAYNDIFLGGYRQAIEDVLEVKRPVAIPSRK